MDFKLTEDEEKRRKEFYAVCEELTKEKPPRFAGWLEGAFDTDEGWAYNKYCAKEFAKRNWLRLSWPEKYGGVGTMMDRVFLEEAKGYYDVPGTDIFGVGMLAPMLIHYPSVTEETRMRFLPPIGNADAFWCQLWSEPNAGSDLANVSTTALRKGNEYIINGQKIWTSGAHRADWGFGLFKSDLQAKKHRNLSFILVDMKTPGITVKPLYYFNGAHLYNEVFFDDVHVPVENRVGNEGEGWPVSQSVSGFERSQAGMIGTVRLLIERMVKYCNETKVGGKLLAQDPLVRNRLAEAACETEALRTLAYYVADQQRRPEGAGYFESSAVKVMGSEFGERMARLAADIMGFYGGVKFSKWAPFNGYFEDNYQTAFMLSIAAGTTEIQKNVIAWYGLGMPRPPRPEPKK